MTCPDLTLADAIQMLLQRQLDFTFASDRVIIKYDAIAAYIERKLVRLFVREKNRGFLERMGVTEFIKYIRICWCNLSYNHIRLNNAPPDVLKYNARMKNVIRTEGSEAKFVSYRLDHLFVEGIVRFAELHDDEDLGIAAKKLEVGKLDFRLAPGKQPSLIALQRSPKCGFNHPNPVNGQRYLLSSYLNLDGILMICRELGAIPSPLQHLPSLAGNKSIDKISEAIAS